MMQQDGVLYMSGQELVGGVGAAEAMGATGAVGATGAAVAVGATGAMGVAGGMGAVGATGAVGVAGAAGGARHVASRGLLFWIPPLPSAGLLQKLQV